MNKKLLSIIMAALFSVSAAAVSAGAAELGVESSKTGTIKFDGGEGWEDKTVCFYIWDDTTKEHAQKDGWAVDDNWGSAKKIGGTKVDGETTVYESFEVDFSGREDHALFVIFHCRETGAQTMNCIINESVLGKTAHRTGIMYENPVDSEKTAEGVAFDGADDKVGVEKLITSSGKIQGDVIAPGKTPDGIVAKFVLDYLGQKEKLSGADIVTEDSVANAITSFGTDNDTVWAKYQTFYGDVKYNEYEAKKVIKPTEAAPDPVSSSVSSSTSSTSSFVPKTTSSNTSSSTVSYGSTSAAASTVSGSSSSVTDMKPSTTVSGTSSTTSTSSTGSSSSGSSSDTKSPKTGVVTNYAAMLAALFTSGAAVAFAGKKRKEND